MNSCPKVLIVSHNVLSTSGNMGRTMADMFSSFPEQNLAQLYFHSEVPTMKMCRNYYRITDQNVLKSVFTRKAKYHQFHESEIEEGRTSSRTDRGLVARIYQFSRRRTPVIYFMRDLMWKLGIWHTKQMDQWIEQFQPDVLFFASGDYVFPYRIVECLAKKHHLPVVMWCCDDYYLSVKEQGSILYRYNKRHLLKWAKKIASLSQSMVTISDKMQKDYSKLFQMPVEVMRISAKENENPVEVSERSGIVYAGNLGVDRLSVLLEAARAIKEAKIPGYDMVDVYSGEKDPMRLSLLKEEKGVRFHGAVPQGELSKILSRAKYLLHVESFDEDAKLRTRYSLSTKIGDSLQSHGVILAYGPQDISSMEYLSEHQAAVMCKSAPEIVGAIQRLNDDLNEYNRIVERAVTLARKCHQKTLNDQKIMSLLIVPGEKR